MYSLECNKIIPDIQVKGEPFSAEKFKSHLLVKSHVRFTAPTRLRGGIYSIQWHPLGGVFAEESL